MKKPIEKTRFEHSALGQVFIIGLKEEEDKIYRILKRLKNILG